MTKEELKQIVDAIKPEPKSENSKLIENISKWTSSISLGLVIWIFSTVNKQQVTVHDMKNNQDHINETVSEIKKDVDEFTKKPRFTSEDFQTKIIPLVNKVNENTKDINERSTWMSKMENRINTQELEIKLLKNEKH